MVEYSLETRAKIQEVIDESKAKGGNQKVLDLNQMLGNQVIHLFVMSLKNNQILKSI